MDRGVRAIKASEILQMGIKEYPTLVEGILPIKGVAALAGSSDLGKSYLLQQLSVAVASGEKNFLGFKLNIQKEGALYISTEDDDFAMSIRLQNLSKPENMKGMERLKFIFDSSNLLQVIHQELKETPCSLVVIDAFADVFRGQLNDTVSVRQFIDPFKSLAQRHDCLIIFNHHCGKHNQYKIPSKDNLLGSQGFESSMRTVMELRQDLNDINKRHLCIVKGNNVGPEAKGQSFELNFDFKSGFYSTGARVPFEQLVMNNKVSKMDIPKRVIELKSEGASIREIAEKLNKEGIEIGKTKVGDILRTTPSANNTEKLQK